MGDSVQHSGAHSVTLEGKVGGGETRDLSRLFS